MLSYTFCLQSQNTCRTKFPLEASTFTHVALYTNQKKEFLLAHAKDTAAIFVFQWAMDAGGQGNLDHQAAFADAVARARQVMCKDTLSENVTALFLKQSTNCYVHVSSLCQNKTDRVVFTVDIWRPREHS